MVHVSVVHRNMSRVVIGGVHMQNVTSPRLDPVVVPYVKASGGRRRHEICQLERE